MLWAFKVASWKPQQTKKPPLLLMVARQGGQRSDQYSGWFGGTGYHTRGSSLAAEHGNMSAAATTCFLRSKGSDRSQGRRIYATNLCNRDDFLQVSEIWWEKASHDCWDMVKVLVTNVMAADTNTMSSK